MITNLELSKAIMYANMKEPTKWHKRRLVGIKAKLDSDGHRDYTVGPWVQEDVLNRMYSIAREHFLNN